MAGESEVRERGESEVREPLLLSLILPLTLSCSALHLRYLALPVPTLQSRLVSVCFQGLPDLHLKSRAPWPCYGDLVRTRPYMRVAASNQWLLLGSLLSAWLFSGSSCRAAPQTYA